MLVVSPNGTMTKYCYSQPMSALRGNPDSFRLKIEDSNAPEAASWSCVINLSFSFIYELGNIDLLQKLPNMTIHVRGFALLLGKHVIF